jgi:lipoyl(octanoyl) transferase
VTPGLLVDLGRAPYAEVHARQLDLAAARARGDGVDTLILVEHPPVITVGRRPRAAHNVLRAGDVPVVSVERGGDVTYHGPGQLVAYPIVRLEDGERDLLRYLRALEAGIIAALAAVGLAGERTEATGVWVGGRKVASIGVACRRWVTFHGLALNVATDLAAFAHIRPCGFDAAVMTSVSDLLGRPVSVDELKAPLVAGLRKALGRSWGQAPPIQPVDSIGPARSSDHLLRDS